MEEYQWSYR